MLNGFSPYVYCLLAQNKNFESLWKSVGFSFGYIKSATQESNVSIESFRLPGPHLFQRKWDSLFCAWCWLHALHSPKRPVVSLSCALWSRTKWVIFLVWIAHRVVRSAEPEPQFGGFPGGGYGGFPGNKRLNILISFANNWIVHLFSLHVAGGGYGGFPGNKWQKHHFLGR